MRKRLVAVAVVVAGAMVLVGQALSNSRTDDALGVAVSPQTLLLGSDQGGFVTVHTAIPFGAVDRSSIQLSGVDVVFTKADSCGNLVAKFSEDAVKAIVAPPETTLTLTGVMKDGESFAGSDTVRVVP